MSSLLKSFFQSSNKHKKLSEEWMNSREPVADGVTFFVRYLGSSLVDGPKCAQSTAAGVKRVIHAAKAATRRPERVAFRVAMEGVRVDSTTTGETIMDTSIYKISYCSADSQYEQILAFVASNDRDTCECHAFLCSKRKVAEAIAVSIAQAFTMAYECWKLALEAKKNDGDNSFTSDEVEGGRGGESPSRSEGPKNSNGNHSSRASSPEHFPGYSSPPSEVSSTSGYQSSNTGGLLLDLDFTENGCDDLLELSLPPPLQQPPTAEVARSRKHWIEFGSCDELLPMGPKMCNSHSSRNIWQPPSREYSDGGNACGVSDSSRSPEVIKGNPPFISLRSGRKCSFNGHFSSSRYSLSDSEQQLLAAAN
ncbi:low density lipoprotein receptor adapter protein 1 [Hyalella azteca]|uniref:Low density lipoprotein receptor adapter protein 1 n=1 Tax=Hyalella azteca TaxID=294128 RepID=A0A8B7P035_HYAAZ|nr:low density lipoprotein receptor adapter protein 1 [Hyalella azteca]